MSGQTWPELSFRMLLRHVYRQQRFWSGIADQQPDGEQHACLLQFLGLAERIYTYDYGQLIKLRMEVDKMVARREQYSQTLDELARDVLAEPGLTVSVSLGTIKAAHDRLGQEIASLRKHRNEALLDARNRAISPAHRGHVSQLGERRADALVRLEEYQRKLKVVSERMDEMRRYRADLSDEIDRIARAGRCGNDPRRSSYHSLSCL